MATGGGRNCIPRAATGAPNQAIVAVGGSGGAGNDAGNVIVNNAGSITTSGKDAHGIFAQSLGGGNMSLGLTVTNNKPVNYIANAAALVLGARPGEGGLGGEVTVNHSGNITVMGDGARGVVAESINGGGGGLSLDITGLAGFLTGDLLPGEVIPDDTEADLAEFSAGIPVLTILGGAAGQGDANANAEKVTLNLTGSIGVAGDFGAGLSQQSIGGGGGHATTRFSEEQARLGEFDLRLGGVDQTGNVGGTISHQQSGSIATTGDGSAGAIVQNIGGGGGLMQFAFIEPEFLPLDNAVASTQPIPFAAVTPTQATPLEGTLTLGADGGEDLSGGTIDYALTGDVLTSGDLAIGLLLQSIGAGGGYADLGNLSGIDVVVGGSNGAAGDGGAVTLALTGDVATTGAASHGLVLQSIGGGGGLVMGETLDESVTLSAGNSGSGGALSLALAGDLVTEGAGAHGIVLQSLGGGGGLVGSQLIGPAGGAGAGGAIALTVDGTVASLGANASAIIAQSDGSLGGGDITISIADGGAVMASEGNVALSLLGGAGNLVTNNGTLASMSGLSGTAMSGTSGDDVLVTKGLLVGSLDLGGGANALTNRTNGQFVSGATLDLGAAGNVFTNAGYLAPGDSNAIAQTALSGSFVQTATGSTFVELDLATQQFDAINATGSVSVDGALDLTLLNPTQFTPGLFSAQIFTGAAGATLGDVALRADSSVVLNLLGVSQTGNAVQVDYDLSFAPDAALGNRAELGEYLDRVQATGVPASLQATFTQLIGVQDTATYIDLLTQLSGDIYAEQSVHALQNSQRFIDRMARCGTLAQGAQVESQNSCAWLEGTLANGDLSAHNGTPAMSSETVSLSAGALHALTDEWTAAFALDYGDYDLSGFGSRWSASGKGFQIGGGLQRAVGPVTISVSAAYGSFDYDTLRDLAGFGGSASSSRKLDLITGQLTGSYDLELGGIGLTPSLALGVTKLSGGNTSESSTTANALRLEKTDGTHGWVMPALGASYDLALSESWTLRPFANLSLRYHLTDPQAEIGGRLASDSTGVTRFMADVPLGVTELAGELGIELTGLGGVSLGASYQLQSSSQRDADVVTLRLSYPF